MLAGVQHKQGRNERGQGGYNSPGAESLGVHRMTAGRWKVLTVSQTFSSFASERL